MKSNLGNVVVQHITLAYCVEVCMQSRIQHIMWPKIIVHRVSATVRNGAGQALFCVAPDLFQE